MSIFNGTVLKLRLVLLFNAAASSAKAAGAESSIKNTSAESFFSHCAFAAQFELSSFAYARR